MALHYTIDNERQVVRTTGSGILELRELRELMSLLPTDPDFNANFGSLVDLRAVSAIAMDSAALAQVAMTSVFTPGTRHAFVPQQTPCTEWRAPTRRSVNRKGR